MFDKVQNNRFRNPIRGRSTPKLTGFGGPRRNHHLPRQPGPETGKSIERELENFFLSRFSLSRNSVVPGSDGEV